jgi:hypothetical protein
MIALFALLAAVTVSLLVARVAGQALKLTGLSHEAARFQARSALTGTGFTTEEAEAVVDHPVRRRILMVLMVLQSAGLVTLVSTLVLSFVDTESSAELLRRGGILLVGLGLLWYLARSRWLESPLTKAIDWALDTFTDLEVTDFFSLLNLEEQYTIGNLTVREDSWIEGRTLADMDLPEEGVLVLGIQRGDDSFVGAPRGRYRVHAGDRLVLYGMGERLADIQKRMRNPEGDRARERAEEEHEEDMARQDVEALEHERRRRAEPKS